MDRPHLLWNDHGAGLPRGTTRVRGKAVRTGSLDSGEASASFTVG